MSLSLTGPAGAKASCSRHDAGPSFILLRFHLVVLSQIIQWTHEVMGLHDPHCHIQYRLLCFHTVLGQCVRGVWLNYSGLCGFHKPIIIVKGELLGKFSG